MPISIINLGEIKKSLDEIRNESETKKEETKKIVFSCPVCGCDKYEGVFQSSPFDVIGGSRNCTEIACKGYKCHAIFSIKILDDFNQE